jgi:two-component system C4-dicarboxylate transport response regulator DctD
MPSSSSILIVTGEAENRDRLAESVSRIGLRTVCCGTSKRAVELLGQHLFSIVFCDDLLPDGTFETVIENEIRRGAPVPVIVTSRRDDWDLFLRALSAGAFDYLVLPPLPGEVERITCAALMECGGPHGTAPQTPPSSMTQSVA